MHTIFSLFLRDFETLLYIIESKYFCNYVCNNVLLSEAT